MAAPLPDDEYPVKLTAPDLSAYKQGNTGVDYVSTFDSGRPGPHVMVNAITHGNEVCGAIALDLLLREAVRPTRGRLTLGFLNVAAYQRFDPAKPSASRFVEEDINRVWSELILDGTRNSVELRRARQYRRIIDGIDYLLDIHSMQHRTPPLMLAGPLAKGRAFAQAVGYPATVVCDEGHAAGKRLRDYAFFGREADPRNALLVECGQHWEPESAAVAIETTLRFLKHLDVVPAAFLAKHLKPGAPARQRVIEVTQAVTVTTDAFRFATAFHGMEVIAKAGTEIARDDDRPVLSPYDNCVLIMPSRRLHRGQTAVRLGRYVAGDFG
ncbi:MAG: succinylglutamate desuccinylase/aspartoacylase family protein [Proteobacteria bacterium]|nr:succinylglutamate desuccinylase/aspartoacylase family protein [Pseudomonadota bacterium]